MKENLKEKLLKDWQVQKDMLDKMEEEIRIYKNGGVIGESKTFTLSKVKKLPRKQKKEFKKQGIYPLYSFI